MTEAVNKRVPIIIYDAGGMPLQVSHGVNGWIVPTGDTSQVAKLLYQLHKGEIQTERRSDDTSPNGGGKGPNPNSIAADWVLNYDEPVMKVRGDVGSTSEDFWTVGNTTRWMLLFSRCLGLALETETDGLKGLDLGVDKNDKPVKGVEVLRGMKVGQLLNGAEVDGENVWKMVMGEDLYEGEGALI